MTVVEEAMLDEIQCGSKMTEEEPETAETTSYSMTQKLNAAADGGNNGFVNDDDALILTIHSIGSSAYSSVGESTGSEYSLSLIHI